MRTRRRIALVLLASAVGLAALECIARVYAHASGHERGLALDSALGWRPLPNVEKRGTLWGANLPARTNTLGWRDKPRDLVKPAGTTRALLIGDSFVFGVGVDDGLRVSEVLEREVPGLEAWNLGVTAYGPDQELILLESVITDYAPDVVVWFACLANDVEDVRYERRYSHPKPWFEIVGDDLVLHAPEPSLLDRLRNASYVAEFLCSPLDSRSLASRVAAPWQNREGLELFGHIAERMASVTERHGAKFRCVTIQSRVPEADARAMAVLRDHGVEPLDLAPVFQAANDSALFLADGHWSAAGHALAAHALARALEQSGARAK